MKIFTPTTMGILAGLLIIALLSPAFYFLMRWHCWWHPTAGACLGGQN